MVFPWFSHGFSAKSNPPDLAKQRARCRFYNTRDLAEITGVPPQARCGALWRFVVDGMADDGRMEPWKLGISWNFMEFDGISWDIPWDLIGSQWDFMEFDGIWWDCDGIEWNFMRFHEMELDLYNGINGIWWDEIFHGISWDLIGDSMDFLGCLKDFYETYPGVSIPKNVENPGFSKKRIIYKLRVFHINLGYLHDYQNLGSM